MVAFAEFCTRRLAICASSRCRHSTAQHGGAMGGGHGAAGMSTNNSAAARDGQPCLELLQELVAVGRHLLQPAAEIRVPRVPANAPHRRSCGCVARPWHAVRQLYVVCCTPATCRRPGRWAGGISEPRRASAYPTRGGKRAGHQVEPVQATGERAGRTRAAPPPTSAATRRGRPPPRVRRSGLRSPPRSDRLCACACRTRTRWSGGRGCPSASASVSATTWRTRRLCGPLPAESEGALQHGLRAPV